MSTCWDIWKELTFQPIPDYLVEEDFLSWVKKTCVPHETTYSRGSSTPPFSFACFDRKKGHDMLILIFDPRFKSIWLVTAFLGCENVIVVDYNRELILPLLIKANKMLMHAQSQCC